MVAARKLNNTIMAVSPGLLRGITGQKTPPFPEYGWEEEFSLTNHVLFLSYPQHAGQQQQGQQQKTEGPGEGDDGGYQPIGEGGKEGGGETD